MISRPRHLRAFQPYLAGKSVESVVREKGLARVVKLASNENPLGLSPKAAEAVKASLGQSNRYADPSGHQLTHKLAEHLGVDPDRIIIGAGIDSLLGYIISAFSDPDDELLTSQGTFTGIYVHANKQGRKLVLVPHDNYHYDLEGLLDSITSRTRIIYLANPNNPTGTIITRHKLDSFLRSIPGDILIILDEAYYSYARESDDYPSGLEYDYDNLIVTRTFSKDYGLAGLRVGYAVSAPDLIADLMKIRLPFEPSYPAQEAAYAALDDKEFLGATLDQNRKSLERIKQTVDHLGLDYPASCANFIMLRFCSTEFAACFTEACLNRGLILRHVESFGVGEGVRINSGTDDETQFAIRVISEVYALVDKQFSKPAFGR